MWAILTVILVFEFSLGATLGRGLNRGLATLVAGALGFGAHYLASLAGEKAGVVTFVRFFPQLKARYDYGLLIFMLTFCLVSISGYREDEILEMAHQRVSTILIGSSTSVFICLLVFPVWASDDLHNLVASNLEKLGRFLEGFGVEYFKIPGDSKESNNTFMDDYKSVLNLKQSEECLVNTNRISKQNSRGMHEYELGISQSIVKSKDAANNLISLLRSGFCKEIDLLEVIPAVTVASLLVDVVSWTEKIAESINELASLAHFQSVEPMVEADKAKITSPRNNPALLWCQ
nr:aluminum-activated malate transporter 2 [Quercus suber]